MNEKPYRRLTDQEIDRLATAIDRYLSWQERVMANKAQKREDRFRAAWRRRMMSKPSARAKAVPGPIVRRIPGF